MKRYPLRCVSTFDRIVLFADTICPVCDRPQREGCQCFTDCRCGWSYRTGRECMNPIHPDTSARRDAPASTI
jgi:hypothetical protein